MTYIASLQKKKVFFIYILSVITIQSWTYSKLIVFIFHLLSPIRTTPNKKNYIFLKSKPSFSVLCNFKKKLFDLLFFYFLNQLLFETQYTYLHYLVNLINFFKLKYYKIYMSQILILSFTKGYFYFF